MQVICQVKLNSLVFLLPHTIIPSLTVLMRVKQTLVITAQQENLTEKQN